MSVLIKDVDKELYRKFKAEAVMRDIKVGTALSLAMENWLKDDHTDKLLLARIKNNETLNRMRVKLLQEHMDKWVLISEGDFVGVFPTKREVFLKIDESNLAGKINVISQLSHHKQRVVRLGIRRKQI